MNFLCYKKKATDKENQSIQGNSFMEGRCLPTRVSSKILEIIDENKNNVGDKKQTGKLPSFRNSYSTKSIDFQSKFESSTNTSISNLYNEQEGKEKESKYMMKYQEIRKNDSTLNKSQEFEILRNSLTISKGFSAKNQLEGVYMSKILDLLMERLLSDHRTPSVLKNHSITVRVRSKMVDWMLEVLCTYKCRTETFYKAVSILDQYLLKTHE